jgi:hypothetical protein
MLGLGLGLNKLRSSGLSSYLKGAMVWGFKSQFKWGDTSTDIWGFANPNDIDPESQAIYDRIIADGGVSNLTRLNYFVVGLKTIYGKLTNVPVCYDAHWIGYKLGSGTGATAGQAAAKLYSLTVAGDAVQTTAASQPLLLAHNGDNYWWGSGVDGNHCSTANRATSSTSTADIKIQLGGGNHTANKTIFAKSDASGGEGDVFMIRFANATTGTIQFYYNVGFGANQISSTGIGAIANYVGWIRVTYLSNGTNADITFYSSTDGTNWTTLSTHNVVSARLGNGSSPYNVCANATFNAFTGKVLRVYYSNSIGGTPVVDFNPATYNAATSQTAWTSATGEVWTINTGTATTGYKGVLVNRTIVMSDGVDDGLAPISNILLFINGTNYTSLRKFDLSVANKPLLMMGSNPNEFDYKHTSNVINSIQPLTTPNLLLNFYAMQRNESSLQAIANLNNGTTTTNTIIPIAANLNRIYLFVNTYGQFGNGIIGTTFTTPNLDNLTTRTAVYNLIRSLNNNAF